MPTEHDFPSEHVHFKWDVGNEPALAIRSGDTVSLESRDVSDNQITPSSTAKDVETVDWDRVYPLAGPISVEGAEPGDTLAIEILELRVQDWGWTAIIPGLGLLPDDFASAYLRVFDLTDGEHAFLREDVAIPIEPFFGTMGVCPRGARQQQVMPPGRFGGNMDTRQLVDARVLGRPVRRRVELRAELVGGDAVCRRFEAVLLVRVRLAGLGVDGGAELRRPEPLPDRHVGRDRVRQVDVARLAQRPVVQLPETGGRRPRLLPAGSGADGDHGRRERDGEGQGDGCSHGLRDAHETPPHMSFARQHGRLTRTPARATASTG